jgi:hypothetical protein
MSGPETAPNDDVERAVAWAIVREMEDQMLGTVSPPTREVDPEFWERADRLAAAAIEAHKAALAAGGYKILAREQTEGVARRVARP